MLYGRVIWHGCATVYCEGRCMGNWGWGRANSLTSFHYTGCHTCFGGWRYHISWPHDIGLVIIHKVIQNLPTCQWFGLLLVVDTLLWKVHCYVLFIAKYMNTCHFYLPIQVSQLTWVKQFKGRAKYEPPNITWQYIFFIIPACHKNSS